MFECECAKSDVTTREKEKRKKIVFVVVDSSEFSEVKKILGAENTMTSGNNGIYTHSFTLWCMTSA